MAKVKSFICFEPSYSKGKTNKWNIVNSTNKQLLGQIKWYTGFRKYVFAPNGPDIVFDSN